MFRPGSPDERGPVAFAGGGMERKLTYHQQSSARLLQVEIHFSCIITENAHRTDFGRQPRYIFHRVVVFGTQQHEKAAANGSGDFPFHPHFCAAYPLNQRSQ
jgi:hypothetical protein